MSFDVLFQGFLVGGSSETGSAQMREVLAPHISEQNGAFLRVRVGDGEVSHRQGQHAQSRKLRACGNP